MLASSLVCLATSLKHILHDKKMLIDEQKLKQTVTSISDDHFTKLITELLQKYYD